MFPENPHTATAGNFLDLTAHFMILVLRVEFYYSLSLNRTCTVCSGLSYYIHGLIQLTHISHSATDLAIVYYICICCTLYTVTLWTHLSFGLQATTLSCAALTLFLAGSERFDSGRGTFSTFLHISKTTHRSDKR